MPRPRAYLRPDMTVSVDVEVARAPRALVVPAEAVRGTSDSARPGSWSLRGGRAERRAVRLGPARRGDGRGARGSARRRAGRAGDRARAVQARPAGAAAARRRCRVPFEWFVALRYLREGRMQTVLILSGVAVGVGVIVFLSALINGLQTSLIEQTLGSQAHVVVRPPDEVARPLRPRARRRRRHAALEKSPQRLRSIASGSRCWRRHRARCPASSPPRRRWPGSAFATRGNAEQVDRAARRRARELRPHHRHRAAR